MAMTGRSDLGVYRVGAKAIPKQSKVMTKTGTGNTNATVANKPDIQKKMKKIMKMSGMLDKC